MADLSATARQKFNASAISLPGEELMMCDLDGDGLTDLVLLNGHDLSVFYQDAGPGFPHEPQQTYRLDNHPCIVWAANLGRPAGSLLVMTSDGVSELSFTNRTGPPILRLQLGSFTSAVVSGVKLDVTMTFTAKAPDGSTATFTARGTNLLVP